MNRQQWIDRWGWTPPETWEPKPHKKPESCNGCPLHGKSTYYVPDETYADADTTILFSHPGPEEEKYGIPACGKTGEILNNQFIPLAGLARGSVSTAHVIKCRNGTSVDLPHGDELVGAIQHCTREHLRISPRTELLITQGKLALDYATQFDPLYNNPNEWRGYSLPKHLVGTGAVIFVTASISDAIRDATMSWVSNLDWRRIRQLRSREFPAPHPPWDVATRDSVDTETREFFSCGTEHGHYLTIDTEFEPTTNTLSILGIGLTYTIHSTPVIEAENLPHSSHNVRERNTHRINQHTRVLSVNWEEASEEVKHYIRDELTKLVRRLPVVFHNAIADIPVLEKALGITYETYKQVEDTMLAHAILWCELPHSLEFLASIYGKHGKFKHLWKTHDLLYNYGDVVDTQAVWEGMVSGFQTDSRAEEIYRSQSLRLIPILLQARTEGIRVNQQRVLEVFNEFNETLKRIERYAQLSVGYPINLNSGQQLKHYLYTVRRYPVQIDKDTKRPTTSDDAINRLRQATIPFDTGRELTLDVCDAQRDSVFGRVERGADPILEARALYGSTWHTINNYIIGLCNGIYQEESTSKKKKARTQYWKSGITLDDIAVRVYPNFAIHAQRTGRWSTTDPPLAQLPADLRDIICPDPDEVCVTWDWSAIEPRVLQALTGSQLLKKTFDENFDLHTWTVCYMFGYEFPPDLVDPHRAASCEAWRIRYNWKGKDDPRRVFAKQGRYEMWYGGTGSNAAQSAASFGLNAKDLKVALAKLATSDPAYYTWKVKTEIEVKHTALIRTFMGRPRRFLNSGDKRRREGLDQPMQGAVSDIFNTTAVLLKQEHPYLRWGWGMHDSQKWYVKAVDLTPARFDSIKQIVERPHTIAGQVTRFPGDFEIILPPERGNLKVKPQQYFALAA